MPPDRPASDPAVRVGVGLEAIQGADLRDETIRQLQIVGNNFNATWAADGDQYVVVSECVDNPDAPTQALHATVRKMCGDPTNVNLIELTGYPPMPMRLRESSYASFWGCSCVAIEGTLYQTLHTANHPYLEPDGSFAPDFRIVGCKLIFSEDLGVTWRNQDGSSPVIWNDWTDRSSQNMLFWENDEAFAETIFIQMGKDYSLNSDGYVYLYGKERLQSELTDELFVCRVLKTGLCEKSKYEYYVGRDSDGSANWVKNISLRKAIHKFPSGWVTGEMAGAVPAGWFISSIVYNAPLDLFMFAATGPAPGITGGWFGAPSYLGIWIAKFPWGPFNQIHEDKAWTPGSNGDCRAFHPQIPPAWIGDDGKSFWLTWSDYGMLNNQTVEGEFNPDQQVVSALRDITDDAEFAKAYQDWTRRNQPNAVLNMQRVDLLLSAY